MQRDYEPIRAAIRQSNLLSSVEKAEWLQLLPDMTDQQIDELVGILKPDLKKTAVPVPPSVKPLEVPQRPISEPEPKVDIKQKEISTSIPFYEPELPAHVSPQAVMTAAPKTVPAPADPTELQKRVASIVEELEQKRHGKSGAAALIPSELKPVQKQPEKHEAAKHEPEMIALRTPEDFSKITVQHLHGADFPGELKKIYDSMQVIAKKSSIYEVVEKFEKSPLYRTYIEMGIELLNDPALDRDLAYANVIKNMQAKGGSVMSKQEFEQFADFRKKIEQVL